MVKNEQQMDSENKVKNEKKIHRMKMRFCLNLYNLFKGRRQTMEDRFGMVQIPVPHLPDEPIVRLFAVLDGHGGQVSVLVTTILDFGISQGI